METEGILAGNLGALNMAEKRVIVRPVAEPGK